MIHDLERNPNFEGVVKMTFFDALMIKRAIKEEIIILLLQQVKIGD